MLHPSYNELMDYVNENAAPQENGEPLVQSRYTLVMAAAKRARQIVEARSRVQDSYTAADKPLSVAVKELYSGEVRILGENEEPDAVLAANAAGDAESGEASDVTAQEDEDFPETGEAFAEAAPEEMTEDVRDADAEAEEEDSEEEAGETEEAASEETAGDFVEFASIAADDGADDFE